MTYHPSMMHDEITDYERARRVVRKLVNDAQGALSRMRPDERAISGEVRRDLRAALLIERAWIEFNERQGRPL